MLALDGSASVSFEEFTLLTGGLGAALQDPAVVARLVGGARRASLLSLLLWSGPGAQAVVLDWTRVATPAEAATFAQAVADAPRIVPAGETAIGEALAAAGELLAALPCPAARRVVDVAGDGRSNAGARPEPARDRLAAAGVTVNGLCVLHEEADLLQRYADEVIGGPDAFAVACADYAGFAEAMRRKLVRETA